MRITTKGRYALRAILHLVRTSNDKPVSIRNLSEETCLSPEFLEQIFFRLRKAGLISSTRGPGGGFSFTKSLSEVSIDDIFMAIDEGYHITPCTLSEPVDPETCGYANECCACEFWQHTYNIMRAYFGNVTIQNILDSKYPTITV